MRKLSLVFVAAMLLSVGSVFANESSAVDPSKSLSVQISQLLKSNTLTQNEVELTAQVRFTLNKEHQIVVLSVVTENPIIAEFVKAKLNYKNVDLNDYKEGKMYTFPVRIVG
ncbi:hypothetical protein LCGC14_1813070 [marine sediment metagenome]|uniref:TonB protein C-terminal n=2 Tax=root TaxID=1 RepID=A0A831QJC7_9FLAO|nr:hypothetical protein [Pricia antarctica]